jgi:hypothetical protein
MAHYLFSGAGFSRNWGCWLADEVFEYLLADPQVSMEIRTQLWRDRSAGGNYEDTITAFIGNKTQYDLLLSILAGMFNKMRNAYTGMGFHFEWTTNRVLQVHTFLQRFDAIFTLNQDTLLEHHYLTQFLPSRPDNRWPDWDMPGLIHTRGPSGIKNATAPKTIDGSAFALQPRSQPYLKLHGSHDWTTSSGYLLITGGNKETAIGEIPLLTAYLNHFRTSVCSEHARLMIIGYSFGDRHINSILLDAARVGAKFFVVDTAGVNVLYKQPHGGAVGQTLRDQMWPSVIGGSRRPLTSTFNNDRIEHDKLSDFFHYL